MTTNAQTVARFLTDGGELRTRLRERSDGDIHDYPFLLPPALRLTLESGDIVSALAELEQCSVVVRREIVHGYDSAEYLITWRSARRRRGPPPVQVVVSFFSPLLFSLPLFVNSCYHKPSQLCERKETVYG